MNSETRDAFIAGLDEAFRRAGAEGYDQGMAQVIGMFEKFLKFATLVHTKDRLTAALDVLPDPKPEEGPYAVALGKYWPELLSISIADIAKMMLKDFGGDPGGRPAVKHDDRLEIVRYMGKLIVDGYTVSVAKRSAAAKFKVSERSAERAWQNRARLQEGEREVSLAEAKEWFRSFLFTEVESIKFKRDDSPALAIAEIAQSGADGRDSSQESHLGMNSLGKP